MSAVREVAAMQWTDNGIGEWMTWLDDLADGTTPVFSGGYTATVAGKAVKLASQDRPTGTVSYTSDRQAAGFTSLRGVGSTALDTQELVTGGRTEVVGSYTFTGDESWQARSSNNVFYTNIVGLGTVYDIICSEKYIPGTASNWTGISDYQCIGATSGTNFHVKDPDITTTDQAKAAMAGITIYYKKATPTTTTLTPQPLSTVTGTNIFYESSMNIPSTPMALRYTGTDYNIPTISGQKYLSRVNGVESVVNGGTAIAVRGGRDRLINLTRWCGAGLEPSTADAFYALYPWMRGYDMPAMQGTLKGYEGTGIETVGFNAYDPSTGQALVLGGHQYQITGTYTALAYSDGTAIIPDASGFFTPTTNDLLTVTGGNDSDTCIHLTWTHYRDGDYEPYWSQVRSLPIAQHFPDGMQGNGTTWDSLYPSKSVQRWKRVDLGTLEWEHRSTVNANLYSAPFGDYKYVSNVGAACDRYSYGGTAMGAAVAANGNKIIRLYFNDTSTTGLCVYIVDSAYANSDAQTFKTAMSGTYLWYVTTTPVTTPIDPPIPMSFRVSDYGLELSLPQTDRASLLTSPLRAVIAYSTDFVRELVNLPKNYTSQDTLDDLLAALATSMGKTITKRGIPL